MFTLPSNNPPVVITVKNVSSQGIEILAIHGGGDPSQTSSSGPLRRGGKCYFSFTVPGEAGYSLEIIFADKRKLAGGGGYVESGYAVLNRVGDTAISNETDASPEIRRAIYRILAGLIVGSVVASIWIWNGWKL
jgi:hypothetical protein